MNINIRSIKPADLDALLAIENASFPEPWELQDFRTTLNQSKNVGFLAETHCEIVGYFIYRLEEGQYSIISMAVAPHMRRQGIGRMMFEKLVIRLSQSKRTQIVLTASEQNLEAHFFYRALGFKAVEVLWDFYGPGHDGYDFVYNIGSPYKYNKNKQLDEACQGK
jgi:ribosomal-protein-alanine N-acetyltransferase